MARSYAPLLTSIWTDREFCALPDHAQRVFFIAISQPHITYCGIVPFTEKRWASLASNTTTDYVNAAVDVLIDRGYVLVDDETEELWVRSFVKHNGVLEQPQLRKAMVKAYATIMSPAIKAAFYEALPDAAKDLLTTPAEGCPQGSGRLREPCSQTEGLGQGLDPDLDTEHSSSSAAPATTAPAGSPQAQGDDDDVFHGACREMARRQLERLKGTPGEVRVPASWLPKVADDKWREHLNAADRFLRKKPHLSADELADLLEPNVPPPEPEASPLDGMAAAAAQARVQGQAHAHEVAAYEPTDEEREEARRVIDALKTRKAIA